MITDERELAEAGGPERKLGGPNRGQIIALVVALCFLSGVIGWWIAQPGEQSFNQVDVGFLSDMETHHNGAISMSFVFLGREHDRLVGHFAREIILAQTQEIVVMNGLLTEAGNPSSVGDDVAIEWMGMAVPPAQMPGMATEEQLAQLGAAQGLDADEQFTRLMMRHHAAGAAMADFAVAHGENDRVKNLAAAMARVQRTEIREMNARRTALGLPVVPSAELKELEDGHAH